MVGRTRDNLVGWRAGDIKKLVVCGKIRCCVVAPYTLGPDFGRVSTLASELLSQVEHQS